MPRTDEKQGQLAIEVKQNEIKNPYKLDAMPPEVVAHIYSFLPFEQRFKKALVNRYIQGVVKQYWGKKVQRLNWQLQQKGYFLNSELIPENKQILAYRRMLKIFSCTELFQEKDKHLEIHYLFDGVQEVARDQEKFLTHCLLWHPENGIPFGDLMQDDAFHFYLVAAILANNIEFIQSFMDNFDKCLDLPQIKLDLYKMLLPCLISKRVDIYLQIQNAVRLTNYSGFDAYRNTPSVDYKVDVTTAALFYCDASDAYDIALKIGRLGHIKCIEKFAEFGRLPALKYMIEEFVGEDRFCEENKSIVECMLHSLAHGHADCADFFWHKINKNNKWEDFLKSDVHKITKIFRSAMISGNLSIITWMWQHLGPVNKDINISAGKNNLLISLIIKSDYLNSAIEAEHFDIARWLIRQLHSSLRWSYVNKMRQQFLSKAIKSGNTTMMQFLDDIGTVVINDEGSYDYRESVKQLDFNAIFGQAAVYGNKELLLWLWPKLNQEQRAYWKDSDEICNYGEDFIAELACQEVIAQPVIEPPMIEEPPVIESEVYGLDEFLNDISSYDLEKMAYNDSTIAKQLAQSYIPKFTSVEGLVALFDAIGIGCGNKEGNHQGLSHFRKRVKGLGLFSKVTFRETDDSEILARAGIKQAKLLLDNQKAELSAEDRELYNNLFNRQIVRKESKKAVNERQQLVASLDEPVKSDNKAGSSML